MELVARTILALPVEEGVSRAGRPWRKQSWIVETFGNYPRKVKVDLFGQNLDNVHLELGKVYNLSVDAESREFNGRWYTDISCFAARETEAPQWGAPAPSQPAVAAPAAPAASFPGAGTDPFAAPSTGAPGSASFEDSSDDLPF